MREVDLLGTQVLRIEVGLC